MTRLGARSQEVQQHLPLAPPICELLLALVDEPRHGYAIMKAVAERTEHRIELLPGTLYRMLARLAKDGIVEVSDERPNPQEDDERRRYYHLTPFGRQVIRAEAERLASQVVAAREKKLLPRTGAS